MTGNILITGGTGFVGSAVVKALLTENKKVFCLVRKSSYQGQFAHLPVNIIHGDVTDCASLQEPWNESIDTVIHCVGILKEKPPHITHQKIVIEGTSNLIKACQQKNIKKIIYISGLGTHNSAKSLYHQAKWAAEQSVRESGLNFVIFRPSVIFGKEDDFLNQFEKMSRFSPFIPVVGNGEYQMQPVSIHDVSQCIVDSIESVKALNQTIEIGGPQRYSFNSILKLMLESTGRRRILLHLPMKILNVIVPIFEKIQNFPLSLDQMLMLSENNVTENKLLHQVFSIKLQTLTEGLKEYSWSTKEVISRDT
ncbi:MAG: complex I NDUFA9 subunit family protein [Deltaproteobacteria bacterium]|nr:complex I NDUFA9 subunit family protein [Deltaproteobacteria bacterium]